jgi:dUTP pyrophosphatase
VEVLITRLDPDVPLPSYARQDDAGADLVCAEDVDLAPGQRAVVGTGIAIALPAGYAGYRGEIRVVLLNTDPATPVSFRRGDRIAQLVVQRVERAAFREVAALPDSARGDNGFGSTGGHAGGLAAGVTAG